MAKAARLPRQVPAAYLTKHRRYSARVIFVDDRQMSAVQRTAPIPPTHDPLNRLANAVLLGVCSERSVPGDIIDVLQKAIVTEPITWCSVKLNH